MLEQAMLEMSLEIKVKAMLRREIRKNDAAGQVTSSRAIAETVWQRLGPDALSIDRVEALAVTVLRDLDAAEAKRVERFYMRQAKRQGLTD